MFNRRNRDWHNDDQDDQGRPGYDYDNATGRNRGGNFSRWGDTDMGSRSGYGRGYDDDYDDEMSSMSRNRGAEWNMEPEDDDYNNSRRYGGRSDWGNEQGSGRAGSRGMSRDWDNSDHDFGSGYGNRNNRGYGMANRGSGYERSMSRDWDNSDNDFGGNRSWDNANFDFGGRGQDFRQRPDLGSSLGSEQGSQWRGQHYGRGPKGYQRSDERIREDVNERLTWHGEIDASEIEVTVNGGEVTLEGTVDNRRTKRIVEDTIEMVRGVNQVHNRLRVQGQNQGSQWGSSQHNQAGMSSGMNTSMTGGAQSSGSTGESTTNRGNRPSS